MVLKGVARPRYSQSADGSITYLGWAWLLYSINLKRSILPKLWICKAKTLMLVRYLLASCPFACALKLKVRECSQAVFRACYVMLFYFKLPNVCTELIQLAWTENAVRYEIVRKWFTRFHEKILISNKFEFCQRT